MNLTDSHTCIDRKKLCEQEHTHVYLSRGIITNDVIVTCHNAHDTTFPNASIIRLSRNEIGPIRYAFSTKLSNLSKIGRHTCFETEYPAKISPNFASRRYIPKNFFIYLLARNLALDAVARRIRTRIFQPVFHEYLRKSF